MGNKSILSVLKAETKLAAALPAELPNATFIVNGKKVTTDQAKALYESHVQLIGQIELAKAQLHQMVEQADAMLVETSAQTVSIRTYAEGVFGVGSTQCINLGFLPRKRAAPSVPTRAKALAKSLATREVRHTMGKKQKEAIEAPPSAPAAPTAPAMPAVPGVTKPST
jgi:hypothetical protein